MPEDNANNVDAVIKPFQFWVWMGLLIASVTFFITISVFNRIQRKIRNRSLKNDNEDRNQPVGVTEKVGIYIIATLLGQGGYISCKITSFRIVIGAWCLLTLVLVNVYNGVLISYVTATRQTPPLINSIDDVATKSNIHIIVNKGQGPDIVLSGVTALKAAIRDDYQQNHQCKLTITAPESSNRAGSWGLAKKSRHLEKFNRGILELREAGLISYWEKQFDPNTKPCFSGNRNHKNNKEKNKKPLHRLSLANLTGAFALLAFGWLISLFVFLIEKVISVWKANQIIVVV